MMKLALDAIILLGVFAFGLIIGIAFTIAIFKEAFKTVGKG